jgi:hypothetical protein
MVIKFTYINDAVTNNCTKELRMMRSDFINQNLNKVFLFLDPIKKDRSFL